MESDLRRSARYPFYATARITELQTQTRLNARTSELSRHGCYMDMLNPFPLGTSVKIEVTHGDQTFSASGHVVYSQTNIGMGVSFNQVENDQLPILEKWISDLGGDKG
jgi:hypothetical protein